MIFQTYIKTILKSIAKIAKEKRAIKWNPASNIHQNNRIYYNSTFTELSYFFYQVHKVRLMWLYYKLTKNMNYSNARFIQLLFRLFSFPVRRKIFSFFSCFPCFSCLSRNLQKKAIHPLFSIFSIVELYLVFHFERKYSDIFAIQISVFICIHYVEHYKIVNINFQLCISFDQ